MTDEQIHALVKTGDPTQIITLITTLRDQRDRAELLNRGYLHEISLLSKRIDNVINPHREAGGDKRVENVAQSSPRIKAAPTPPPPPESKKKKGTLDIQIDL